MFPDVCHVLLYQKDLRCLSEILKRYICTMYRKKRFRLQGVKTIASNNFCSTSWSPNSPVIYTIFRGGGRVGVQGWRSGESSRLPPPAVARARFLDPASRMCSLLLVQFSSLLRGFFSRFSSFPPSIKTGSEQRIWSLMRCWNARYKLAA